MDTILATSNKPVSTEVYKKINHIFFIMPVLNPYNSFHIRSSKNAK